MKQAGRIWNKMMNEAMISWGFTCLACKSCIYYCRRNQGIVIVAVHVDDFLSVTHLPQENMAFRAQIKTIWNISDLSEAMFCVGITISCNRLTRTVLLSQITLINQIIT